MNTVTIAGFLGGPPEVRQAGQSAICKMSVAVSKQTRKQDGSFDKKTFWFPVEAWDRDGKYNFSKGDFVVVHGELEHQQWEGRDGQKQSKIVIKASDIYRAQLPARGQGADHGQGGQQGGYGGGGGGGYQGNGGNQGGYGNGGGYGGKSNGHGGGGGQGGGGWQPRSDGPNQGGNQGGSRPPASGADHGPPIDFGSDDIPFGWLIPMVGPALSAILAGSAAASLIA